MPRKTKTQADTKVIDLSKYSPIYSHVWRDLVDPDAPEGVKPLRVKVPISLAVKDVNAIGIEKGTTLLDLWPTLAPFVVEWNVEMLNTETGMVEPVPPPAEAGWEAFYVLSEADTLRLIQLLKFGGGRVVSSAVKTSEESAVAPESASEPVSDSAA
jgi:hypothetical protein